MGNILPNYSGSKNRPSLNEYTVSVNTPSQLVEELSTVRDINHLNNLFIIKTISEKIVPKKLGIRLSPPALILIYEQPSASDTDARAKLRLRTIPLRNLETTIISTDFLLEDLKSRHEQLSSVPDHKIIRMIEIIKKVRTGKGSLEEIVQENCKTVSEKPSKNTIENITNEQNKEKSSKNKVVEEKLDDEDTDFEIDDDLPLDKLESEEDDFWNL